MSALAVLEVIAMRVRVELFGRAATQSGIRQLELDLPDGSTLRDAASAVAALHPALDWLPAACRPARNLEYAAWSDPLADGDEISFIPPVSGGAPETPAEPAAITALRARLADLRALQAAMGLLDWDQQTYMPPGGVAARAEQKAVLARVAHEWIAAPETGDLLAAAEAVADAVAPGSEPAHFLRVARRDYDRAVKVPAEIVSEFSRITAMAQDAWADARARDDYLHFAPWLRRVLDLTHTIAHALGFQDRLYDALIDQYEPHMTSAELDRIFGELKPELRRLIHAVREHEDRVDASLLRREFDEDRQRQFIEGLLTECGFDLQRGRQDRSVHPFCTSFSRDDVRLTTRYDRRFLSSALFGSLHEMGHGLYEQGVAPELDPNILAGGASLGLHESQSRLWENLVGRSRPFWQRYFPRLQAAFPGVLDDVNAEQFYRAINRVAPSLIRVEADEVTYNLHIILRYELENELLEGRLAVEDAPEAWDERMRGYLEIEPASDREGILQDVHWSIGILGYFPTYSLGNVFSVQLWDAAAAELGDISAMIGRGEFAPLLEWLRRKVHCYGRRLFPGELIEQATGGPLTIRPYLCYLHEKYGALYGL